MQTKPTRPAALVLVRANDRPHVDENAPVNTRIQDILGEPAKYEAAFAAFQKAVAAHDAKAVGALVAYPFAATVGGRQVKLPDAAAFVRHYDVIVTPAIANVITRQRYEDLFVNADGVMFGRGEAWLNGKDADVRVIAIQSSN
ncbi:MULTISPECIES: hypothetical protein [Corallococcus]|uniref:hypothetical protein n=1 Tax=Corallococcus TaxID=83461 RepID=UPI0011C3A44D|nr:MULTISPECIES: hypothetical protein [Corallococcus]